VQDLRDAEMSASIRLLFSAIGIAIGASSGAAPEIELPQYDTGRYCTEIATATSTLSAAMVEGCVLNEIKAYNRLSDEWPDLPDAMKEACVFIVQGISPSYTHFEACIARAKRSAAELGQ
jgi:hypothetical protein